MLPGEYGLKYISGMRWDIVFALQDATGVAINLTGATVQLLFYSQPLNIVSTPIITLTNADFAALGVAGTITPTFLASKLALLLKGYTYFYRLQVLTVGQTDYDVYIEGTVEVQP